MNFRGVLLSCLGTLMLLAFGASAASAASYKSEVSSPNKTFVTLASEIGNQIFRAGSTTECTRETGQGAFVSGASSLKVENIAYSGCKIAGQAATVKMNGCGYKFGEPTGSASPFTVKTITIEGASCTEIVITATTAGCTIKVKPQTTTGTSTAQNVLLGASEDAEIRIGASISGITSTSSGGICGPAGTTSTATYTGTVLVAGFEEFRSGFHVNQVDIFVS